MELNDLEWQKESAYLSGVLAQAQRQYEESLSRDERLKEEALETQKELWETVGPISPGGGLEQMADFMGYIDAMKRQKQTHSILRERQGRYERMLDSPYFGRVDFQREGEEGARAHYIGLSNLTDEAYKPLVIDWRAPVASLFYDFETGRASYQSPRGMIEGELALKRQYQISGGRLNYMFDSSLKIDDEILREILGKSTDGRMKAIVTSIQREQNRAIRDERYKILIVEGAAGSGKTSVALHRAAYLLYRYRDKIASRNILILSPNRVFGDYIAGVLPELGEENIRQTTFSEYLDGALRLSLKKESVNAMMEYLLAGYDRPTYPARAQSIRLKSSARFLELLERYAQELTQKGGNFADIEINGTRVFAAAEMDALYHGEYRTHPMKKRMERIQARCLFLLKNWEDARAFELKDALRASGKQMSGAEWKRFRADVLKRETKDARAAITGMTAFDPTALYKEFIAWLPLNAGAEDGEALLETCRDTLENLSAGQLFFEDQAPLAYLAGLLGALEKDGDIRFVIIDEAQDYTPLQHKLLRLWFGGANLTLLGDAEQAVNPYAGAGLLGELARLFPEEDTLVMKLNKSYRSTAEIAAFASSLLPPARRGESVARHGEEPVVRAFSDSGALRRQVVSDIEAFREQRYRSIAVIARTKQEARDVHRALKDKVKIGVLLGEEEEYASGALVIPSYLTKGLEFDAVILYDAGEGNYAREEERALLYTVCTRALHKLRVYYTGQLTPLLRSAALQHGQKPPRGEHGGNAERGVPGQEN